VLVATPRLAAELAAHGIHQTRIWSRGVDFSQFGAAVVPDAALAALPRPIALCVGRVAVEKNIAAFLDADFAGTKVVVGDGPALAAMRARYPKAVFTGALHGAALASAYATADVFAFPSRTDTFGLVMIEALACGVPVAGFPVAGPLDVIGADGCGVVPGWRARIGAVDDDFAAALRGALTADRGACAAYAWNFSWDNCLAQFLGALAAPVVPALAA
jgi:glycosyltransferase involved in cell wall biosynthesis